MNFNNGGTVAFGSVYGPSGGQAVAQKASVDMGGGGLSSRLPLTLPTLIVLALAAWWALEKWD